MGRYLSHPQFFGVAQPAEIREHRSRKDERRPSLATRAAFKSVILMPRVTSLGSGVKNGSAVQPPRTKPPSSYTVITTAMHDAAVAAAGKAGELVLSALARLPFVDAAGGWRGSTRQITTHLEATYHATWNRGRVARVVDKLVAAGVVVVTKAGDIFRRYRLVSPVTGCHHSRTHDKTAPLPPGEIAPSGLAGPQAARPSGAHITTTTNEPHASAPAVRQDEGKRHRRGRALSQGLAALEGILGTLLGTAEPRTSTSMPARPSTPAEPRGATSNRLDTILDTRPLTSAETAARRSLLLAQAHALASAAERGGTP